MKKLFAIILAMALLLCSAAMADENAVDISGRWELTGMTRGNQTVDAAALEAAGMTMIFDLYADGSVAARNGYGEQMPGEWTVSGNCVTISLEGDPLDFYLVNGQLQSDDSIGFVMILTRTGDVEQAAVPEGLVGRWELTGAIMGEEVKDAGALAEMGVAMTVELYADGSASGENGFTLAEGSWAADGETVTITLAGSEMPFLLQDGQLRSNDGSMVVLILSHVGDVEAPVPVDTAAFVGHWVMTSASMGEQVMDAAALEAAGMTMIIDLYEGGVAWANNGYEQLTGLWMAVGTHVTVTIDGDPLDFYLVDGHLESDGSRGFVMTLNRVEE